MQPGDCKDTCPNNRPLALMFDYVTIYAGPKISIQVPCGQHTKRQGHTLKGQTVTTTAKTTLNHWNHSNWEQETEYSQDRDKKTVGINKQAERIKHHQWVWFCHCSSVKAAAFSFYLHHKTCLNCAALVWPFILLGKITIICPLNSKSVFKGRTDGQLWLWMNLLNFPATEKKGKKKKKKQKSFRIYRASPSGCCFRTVGCSRVLAVSK